MTYLYVFVGGGLGSILRFALVQRYQHSMTFPIATFIANLLACFVLGYFLNRHALGIFSENQRLLIVTGFCGGLSTFSTLIYEIHQIYTTSNHTLPWVYLGTSILCGILFLVLGTKV
jgi:fluoride exporter